MYKVLIRLLFSLYLLPSLGFGMELSQSKAESSRVTLSPGNHDYFSDAENKERNPAQIHQPSGIEFELSFIALPIEVEESEEDIKSHPKVKTYFDSQVSDFIKAILNDDIFWKVNFKAFSESLDLFRDPSRLHLLLGILII
jgi:hypothetical protein